MNQTIKIIAFALLSLSANAQIEMTKPIPSKTKTEFRYSIFQSNYLTQNILVQFLEQNQDQISNSSDSLKLRAVDLYYDKGGDFKTNDPVIPWIKEKYLTDQKTKIEILNKALDLSEKWQKSIVKDKLLDEILKPINYGYKLSIKNNIIYAVSPLPEDNSLRSIYKFEFNENKKVISQNFGTITRFNDSIFWISTTYEYQNENLSKVVYKICQDNKCAKGYEKEFKTYENGLIAKRTKQSYSRHNNDFVEEEITDYVYNNKKLDSSITNTYKIRKELHSLDKITIRNYSKGNITTMKENYLSKQMFRNQKSITRNTYDRKNRLVSLEFKAWDHKLEIAQLRVEEFEYHKNKYIYRYKQSLHIEEGKKKLPLQYELTYTFH